MAEGVDDEVATIPGGDTKKIQTIEVIHEAQRPKNAEIKYQLLSERERKCGEWARQVALVMLNMDPVKSREMEKTMRDVVPGFRPSSSQ